MKLKVSLILSTILLGLLVTTLLYNYKHGQGAFTSENLGSITLENPYFKTANVYKGQLHCHTTNSDGTQSPSEVVEAYKNAGYDFISITDHDCVTPDPGVEDVLFITGNEVSSTLGHLTTVNVPSVVSSRNTQKVIDWTKTQGGLVWLAHPDFPPNVDKNEMTDLSGYNGIEVYNYPRNLYCEERWDYALTDLDIKITAIAVDDCHDVKNASRFNGGWVMVFANSLTKAEIVNSLEKGNFYSTQGPTINALEVKGTNISIKLDQTSKVTWIGAGGSIFQETTGVKQDTYTVRGNEKYIRIRVESSGHAWTNPIYLPSLVVNSASVSDSRVNPSQPINVNAQVYYKDTMIPPVSGSSLRAYIDLNGETKAALSAIEAGGLFTFPAFPAESSVGIYNYTVYTLWNSQISEQNQTVSVIVDGLKVANYTVNLPSDQLHVRLVHAYDDTSIQNGSVTYSGLLALTNEDGWAKFNLLSLRTVKWGSITYPISEPTYGLTSRLQNQTVSYAKITIATFIIKADNPITNANWDFLNRELTFDSAGTSITDVGGLEKPMQIEVDGALYTGWTYDSTARQVRLNNVHGKIVIQWTPYAAELWIIVAFSIGLALTTLVLFWKRK